MPLTVRARLTAIALVACCTLIGCIPVNVDRTTSFNPDGSGSVSMTVSMPDSMMVEAALANAVADAPSWANARTSGGQMWVDFEFANTSDLGSKLSVFGFKETADFHSEDAGQLLKRRCIFTADIAPASAGDDPLESPLSVTYRLNMPGSLVDAGSNCGQPGVWQLTNHSEGSVSAASVVSVPLQAALDIRMGLIRTTADLTVTLDRWFLAEYDWATDDWLQYRDLLQQTFLGYACTEVQGPPEVAGEVSEEQAEDADGESYEGEGVEDSEGFRFSGEFSSLTSLVTQANELSHAPLSYDELASGVAGGGGLAGALGAIENAESRSEAPEVELHRERSGLFVPRYSYTIAIPPNRGTPLEGIFESGQLSVTVPGTVVSSNAEETRGEAQNTLVWWPYLTDGSTIEFTYTRIAWEIIIPLLVLLLAAAVVLGIRLRPKSRAPAAPAQGIEAEQPPDEGLS